MSFVLNAQCQGLWLQWFGFFFFFFIDFREEGRKRDRNIDDREHRLAASCMTPTGDLACNLGMCPDQESNRPPLGAGVDAQPLNHTGWAGLALKKIFFFFNRLQVACEHGLEVSPAPCGSLVSADYFCILRNRNILQENESFVCFCSRHFSL
uniref:Uncharacterized protein n=1 Tax=Molossus molossus TaxID=27622 RepID=A0A7J8BLW4_MOLMO|nr:hypothetical protein HJG59_010155 [Molossus molossus]